MPEIPTEVLTFYHGTGVAAARSIITGDSKGTTLEELGAFELGYKIYWALLESANLSPDEDFHLHSSFTGPGSDFFKSLATRSQSFARQTRVGSKAHVVRRSKLLLAELNDES